MDEAEPDHKLCGYLCAVLTVPPQSMATTTVPFSAPCHLTTDGDNSVCFQSQDGVVFRVIGNADFSNGDNAGNSREKGSRRRKIGMVNGSISVVHQIHALVSHKCVKIHARVLRVEGSGEEEGARAVVLVDVYLPVELWSGWQFPRSGSVACSLLRHLRYFFCNLIILVLV